METVNWDAVGAIAEMLGALAVFSSLIYLARQIRQSNKTDRLNALIGLENHFQNTVKFWTETSESAEVMVKAMDSWEKLTPTEVTMAGTRLYTLLRHTEIAYYQWKEGVVTQQDFQRTLNIVRIYYVNPAFQQWYKLGDRSASTMFTEEFRDYLEKRLGGQDLS